MASSLHFIFSVSESCFKNFPSTAKHNSDVGSSCKISPILGAHRKWPSVVSRAVPKFKGTHVREQKLSDLIVEKVGEAQEVCQENKFSEECRVAWDEVEEVSQAKAHFRLRSEKQDPLEGYCKENPETDECRIYED